MLETIKDTVMSNKRWVLSSVAVLLSSSAFADIVVRCDDKLNTTLHECERIVGSLRADKAGQMRVFANDGSEYTAGQAAWMKSQLRFIAKACADGAVDDAARRLAEVQELLKEHHRAS
jgi:hypothetical protein